MKLILTNEVSGLGSAGDVVEVKDGYGRNFLLPRGLATPWSKGGQSGQGQQAPDNDPWATGGSGGGQGGGQSGGGWGGAPSYDEPPF